MHAASYLIIKSWKLFFNAIFSDFFKIKPIIMAKVQTTETLARAFKQTKKNLDEDYKPPEPEYSIPTQDLQSLKLNESADVQQLHPRIRLENLKQWINQTKPSKIPFEQDSNVSTWCDSGFHRTDSEQNSIVVSDSIEEEWNQREFDRLYGKIIQKFELQSDNEKIELRRIHEKVKRYKKAFLKGFFEARIRRIESNKWLYDKLHVNPETIKEKYRKLMFTSEMLYSKEENTTQNQQSPAIPEDQAEEKKKENIETVENLPDNDLESVYSFVPERDNVLLQDVNAPPHVRGFGKDRLKKYNTNIKLLHLENWMPPDIQNYLNEKKAAEEEEDKSEAGPDINDKYKNVYLENMPGQKPQIKNEEWKFEQITGVSELPTWLGPKLLDAKPELDLENFRKLSAVEEPELADDVKEEEKRAPEKENAEDDKVSQKPKDEEETNAQKLLKTLTQLQSRDYFKLWYNTHDTFNTTPFLEARLQRLLQEVFSKREWAIYSNHLKNKYEENETKNNSTI